MVNATFYVQIINNFHVVLLLHKPDLVKMSQFFSYLNLIEAMMERNP